MLRIGLEGPVVETASCPPAHGLMRAREPGHYDRKHPDKLRRGPRRRRTKPRVPGDPARLGPGTIGAGDQRVGPFGAPLIGRNGRGRHTHRPRPEGSHQSALADGRAGGQAPQPAGRLHRSRPRPPSLLWYPFSWRGLHRRATADSVG